MKKILLIILSVLILVGGGVGLIVGLKDKTSQKLGVKIYDITVSVGENKAIEYECSNPDAIISFEIDDESVTQVEYISQVPTVKGLSQGTAEITIIVKYKKYKNRATASVTVTNNTGDEEEEPSISLNARANASVAGNQITCTKSTAGYVSFVVDNVDVTNWSISTEDEGINVSKYTEFPQTIEISSDIAGEYAIKLTINGSHEIELSVIVNE